MYIDLYWAIQLVTTANPMLAGKVEVAPPKDGLYSSMPLRTTRLEPRDLPDAPRVANVSDWFKLLKSNGVGQVALSYSRTSPQQELLGPVIHIARPAEIQMWQVDIEQDPDAGANNEIGRGVLRLFGPRLGDWFQPIDVDEALDRHRDAVLSARRYALSTMDGAFCESFDSALKELDATRPTPPAKRIIPLHQFYSPQVRNLAAALSVGWVFGGMGSWTDFAGDEEYAQITDRLWSSIGDAVEAIGAARPV
jgi:hypothetical protein